MAGKELALRYRVPAHTGAVILSCLTFPLWGVVGIIGSMILLMTGNFGLVALCGALLAAGIGLTVIAFDHALVLNAEGLAFPLILLKDVNFRRQRSWADVGRIRVVESNPKNGILQIFFRTGGVATIKLKHLSPEHREELLLAFEVWGRGAEKDPELARMHDRLVERAKGTSFTEIWQEEMGRRFSSTAFVPLVEGTKLQGERLTVVKQHACGGLSAIYLVQVNGKDLAILKEFMVPEVDPVMREKAAELFNREAELLAKLNHPHIARVQDHFVENGRTYLLLDYIAGVDLRQMVLRRGPQPEPQVLGWALHLAEILTYLHGQSPPIVHRDLTPDNIVLAANGELVLIDFGAANELLGTATGTLVGKQAYMAPEQVRGETTTQSDIYSLAATMHYLLTGSDPEPLSPSSPRTLNQNISVATDTLLQICTAFDAGERPANATDLLQQLKQAKEDLLKHV